jgi:tetratricopeptide (TPR) repeat protein
VQAHNNLGLAHVALGEHKKAVLDFSNALVHQPDYVDALNNRGYALTHADSEGKALADFKRALELQPKNAAVFNNRGLLQLRAERYEEAIRDFSKAIELEPLNAKYYTERSNALAKVGRADEAAKDDAKVVWLKELERLTLRVQHKPDDAGRYRERAAHYLTEGETERGLADYKRALRADPDDTRTYVERAAYFQSVRQLDDAIGDCTDAIETAIENGTDPDRDAYSIRGDAYLAQGYYDLAIPDYVKAKRFDAAVAKAYFMRYEDLKSKGKTEAAQAAFEQAVVFDPSLDPDGKRPAPPVDEEDVPPRRIPDTVEEDAEPIETGTKSEVGSRKSEEGESP